MDGIHTSKERRHLVVISCSLHYVNNLISVSVHMYIQVWSMQCLSK